MPPPIATLIFSVGILGLFMIDYDRAERTSKALWIAVVWLLIAGSRPISVWLGLGSDQTADQVAEGSPLDRSFVMALLAIGLIVLIGRWPRVQRILRANVPILVFSLYCALSIVWSDYPDVAFKRWTKFLGDLVMVLIVYTDRDWYAALKRFLARTGFVLLSASVLLIKYYPVLGRQYDMWVGTPSYTGVTNNKNLLGMICLVLGLGSVWRFRQALQRRNEPLQKKHLLAHGAIVAMSVWLLLMAHSTTSLTCFVMGAALIVAANMGAVTRRPILLHLLVAAELSVSFAALFLNIGSSVVESLGKDSTLTGRTDLWKVLLGMANNPVLGAGFESFWLGSRLKTLWNIYWWKPSEAHNGYIEVYLNLGWVGLVLLAIVLITTYRNITRSVRRREETSGLLLAYFVVALIYNFTEAAFKELHPLWIFLLLTVFVSSKKPRVVAPMEQSELLHAWPNTVPGLELAERPIYGADATPSSFPKPIATSFGSGPANSRPFA